MPFTIYDKAVVCLLVLLNSCYSSHKTEDSRDYDDDVLLADSGDRSTDASDSFDAGDSFDSGVDESTFVGTWEGELRFYSTEGVLAGTAPTTIEFTDTGIEVFVAGMLVQFLYSIDSDQTPPHLNVELYDPEQSLSSPYVLPAFYKIEDDILTLGLSFYSLPPQMSSIDENDFPMVFEVVRVP